MRTVSYSAIVIGLVLLGSFAASDPGTAGSYSDAASDHGTGASYSDKACSMPVQFSCRGCAVTCPASKLATCRAGMSIWRSNAWSCLFQPTCSCQKSIWSLPPEQVRQSRKIHRHPTRPAARADAADETRLDLTLVSPGNAQNLELDKEILADQDEHKEAAN
jgi:hypothetical protein